MIRVGRDEGFLVCRAGVERLAIVFRAELQLWLEHDYESVKTAYFAPIALLHAIFLRYDSEKRVRTCIPLGIRITSCLYVQEMDSRNSACRRYLDRYS